MAVDCAWCLMASTKHVCLSKIKITFPGSFLGKKCALASHKIFQNFHRRIFLT